MTTFLRRTVSRVGLVVGVAALLPLATAAAQMSSDTLATVQVTSSSDEAKAEFWAAVSETYNVYPARAAQHLQRALALDPDFGIARVLYGGTGLDLSQAQRQQEMDRGLAAAAHGTTAELLLATAWREGFSGRPRPALAVLRTLRRLAPDDPNVAYQTVLTSATAEQQPLDVNALRQITEKFPDYAPAYNVLAYQLWATGDHAGAFEAVRKYVSLMPKHPNPHDSYAEILQFDGRYEEALPHYAEAVALDSSFSEGYAGMAEIQQLMGHGVQARALWAQAAERSPTINARLGHRFNVATSWIYDRNGGSAQAELSSVAEQAAKDNRPQFAAVAYQRMATVDALLGDGKNVDADLARAAEAGGAETFGHLFSVAAANALARRTAQAREAVSKATAAATNDGQRRGARLLAGMVALLENDAARAMQELAQADPTNSMTRVLMAEAQEKLGHASEARALRDGVLNGNTVDFMDAVARARAKSAK